MTNNGWQIQLIDRPGWFGKEIYIYRRDHNGAIFQYVGNGEEIAIQAGGVLNKPTLYLEFDMMQELADILNSNGFKPKQGFLEGKIEATERHLQDMRTLVFKDGKPKETKE